MDASEIVKEVQRCRFIVAVDKYEATHRLAQKLGLFDEGTMSLVDLPESGEFFDYEGKGTILIRCEYQSSFMDIKHSVHVFYNNSYGAKPLLLTLEDDEINGIPMEILMDEDLLSVWVWRHFQKTNDAFYQYEEEQMKD